MNQKMRANRFAPAKQAATALCVALGLLHGGITPAAAQTSTPYAYQNVLIGADGAVTGLYSHPLNGSIVYVRGDGASYRWDSANNIWHSISDGLTGGSNAIPESIAPDPNNLNVVYVGVDGGVCRSTDQGNTWGPVNIIHNSSGNAITQDWNSSGKMNNPRMAVDPNNSSVLYYGSKQDGLFKSVNSGSTWSKVTSFPTDADPGDVVAFDKGGGTTSVGGQTVSATIFVGVYGGADHGIWRSTDGGSSWSHIGGMQSDVRSLFVTTNGTAYVAGNGAVGKLTRGSGSVTTITPGTASNYEEIAVDVTDATGNTAMVANSGSGPLVWRTTNGGSSWTSINGTGTNAIPWSGQHFMGNYVQGLCFNATNSKEAWVGDWEGPWNTPDVTLGSPSWTLKYNAYEDTTAVMPFCPPSGAPLFSAMMDPAMFRSSSVTAFPIEATGGGGLVQSIAWCESDPNFAASGHSGSYYGYTASSGVFTSTNNFQTETNHVLPNGFFGGHIAVGATKQANGYPIIVWMPEANTPPLMRSTDWGSTWVNCNGAPGDVTIPFYVSEQYVTADRVDGNKFYMYHVYTGAIWRSTDGGNNWSSVGSLSSSNTGGFVLESHPGINGKLWANPGNPAMLNYSNDSGATWTQVANIKNVAFYALGKAASGRTNLALYFKGTATIGGVDYDGMWRSDDATSLTGNLSGATWVRIWDRATDATTRLLPDRMTGFNADLQTYGRVYFTVYGRGVTYGDPSGPLTIPPTPTGLTATPGNAQITLSWGASSGATSYNVKRSTVSGSGYATVASPGTNSYTNTGLTNGTTYYYVVSAVNSAGESANSAQASAIPANNNAQIAGASTAPIIDGNNTDAVWATATSYSLNNVIGTVTNSADLSGSYKAAWDASNLYILADVTDESLIADLTDPTQGDSVEVYVDGNNSKGTSYDTNDWQYVFAYGGNVIKEFSGGTSGTNTAGMSYAYTGITGGYRLELKIPWSTIGVATPAVGANIGLDVAFNDADGVTGRQGKKFWWSTVDNNWTNPSLFGTGTIVAAAGGTAPPAPTSLAATAGNTQVALSWTASTGATSYNVKRSTVSGSGYATVASPTTTSYTNTGLTNGTAYYYVATAVNPSGESGNSNQASATPNGNALITGTWYGTAGSYANSGNVGANAFDGNAATFFDAPDASGDYTGIDVGAGSTATVTSINYMDRGGFASRMVGGVFQGTNGDPVTGTYTTLATITVQPTDGVWSNLPVSASGYRYLRYLGPSNSYCNVSEIQFMGTKSGVSIPPAPTSLTATAGNAQIALSWTASTGATSYNAKRSTVSGSGYATVASPTTTSYTNTGLTNGTTYYYVATAVNSAGESGNSNQASATPQLAIPPAPTGLTATAGNAQIALSWTASTGATSYNVKRSTVSGSGYATVASPTTTSYTNTGLTNGTTYYYVVTAVNASGESGNSNQTNGTPAAAGSLTGSVAAQSSSTVTLTTQGTLDWAHWGTSSDMTMNHKSSGGSKISAVSNFGSGGAYGRWNDAGRNMTWTDGTPTASATNDENYIWDNGANNTGWTFTVPADTTSKTLKIYVGSSGVNYQVMAHLSDGSAADVTKTVSSAGVDFQCFTFTYNAASAAKTLTLTITKTLNNATGSPSVDLDAATLQ